MQFPAGLFACELPVDRDAVTVDAALPSMNFAAKSVQVTDSALFQTLAAEPCSRRFRPGLANCRAWADREAVPQQAIHRQPVTRPAKLNQKRLEISASVVRFVPDLRASLRLM